MIPRPTRLLFLLLWILAMIGIVAILPLNYFSARLERVRRQIEGAMNQLVILLKKK